VGQLLMEDARGNGSEQPGEKQEGNSCGLLAGLEKARPKLQFKFTVFGWLIPGCCWLLLCCLLRC